MIGLIAYTGILLFLTLRTIQTPAVALAGCLTLFGLEQWGQAKIPFLIVNYTFTNYVVAILVVLGFARLVTRARFKFRDYPFTGYLVIIFLFYAYISTYWTTEFDLSLAQWELEWPYILSFVVIAPLLLVDTQGVRRFLSSFLIVGSVLAILLIVYVKWEGRSVEIRDGAFVEYGNPLAIAQMAGNTILVTALCPRLRPLPLWGLLRWVAIAVCIALSVKSGSRGQVLFVLPVLLVFWPLTREKFNLTYMLIALFGILLLGLGINYAIQVYWGADIRWDISGLIEDLRGRWYMVGLVLREWWSGGPLTILVGLGNSESFNPRIVGFYPHILPLEILAEEGVIGFLFFLIIIGLGVLQFVRSFRLTKDSGEERETVILLAAMYTYSLMLSLKQGNLIGSTDVFMGAILLAKYALYLQRQAKKESPDRNILWRTWQKSLKILWPTESNRAPVSQKG